MTFDAKRHRRALALAPKPGAALSFFSCLYIVCSVLSRADRRSRLYHRICLAMALNGLVYSFAFFWGTWAMPAEVAGEGMMEGDVDVHEAGGYMAAGTWCTCSAQGFLIQHGFAVPCYYCSLSLYSLVAVRCNFDQRRLARLEPWIHLVCNLFPLCTAVVLQRRQLLNPSGAWCWIGRYPAGCEGDDCLRGGDADVYMWAFAFGPIFFNLGFSTCMMGLLLRTIRRRERASRVFVGKNEVLEKARRARSRMVLRQASQYLAAFYVTYSVSIASRLVQSVTGRLNPSLHVASVAVVPLQGFFYFLVYARLRVSSETDNGDDNGDGDDGRRRKVRLSVVDTMRRLSLGRLSLTKGMSEAILAASRRASRRAGLASVHSRWGLGATTATAAAAAAAGGTDDDGAAPDAAAAASRKGSDDDGRQRQRSWMSGGSRRSSGAVSSNCIKREFSIFDGTNCATDSIWAKFLIDDEDDEEEENEDGSNGGDGAEGGAFNGEIPGGATVTATAATLPRLDESSGNATSGTSGGAGSASLFADSGETPGEEEEESPSFTDSGKTNDAIRHDSSSCEVVRMEAV